MRGGPALRNAENREIYGDHRRTTDGIVNEPSPVLSSRRLSAVQPSVSFTLHSRCNLHRAFPNRVLRISRDTDIRLRARARAICCQFTCGNRDSFREARNTARAKHVSSAKRPFFSHLPPPPLPASKESLNFVRMVPTIVPSPRFRDTRFSLSRRAGAATCLERAEFRSSRRDLGCALPPTRAHIPLAIRQTSLYPPSLPRQSGRALLALRLQPPDASASASSE